MKMQMKGMIRAAEWVLCGAVLFAASSRAQEPRHPDLSGMDIEDLTKLKMETVYGASKFLQKASDAPASVTIVTAEQIQKTAAIRIATAIPSA